MREQVEEQQGPQTLWGRCRRVVFGKARRPDEPEVFHKISLIAFLAWIGLGADGISSACYGPAETFKALGQHHYLALILAALTAITVFIISASYKHIIELFPSGGGGYLVASKLLSPKIGAVSGCALLVDYVLTIITSIASGADAVFSMLPPGWHDYKLPVATVVLVGMIVLNMRGVKESVLPIVPVFLLFLATHAIAIAAAISTHFGDWGAIGHKMVTDLNDSRSTIGSWGLLLLLLHAYSLGGSSYTGIEAVSNGLPILREPRVATGKRTMTYMAFSLAIIAGGLILGFVFFNLGDVPVGKTLNAVFFERVTTHWPGGAAFVLVALTSEALILLVAAQTGFLDGPRVLANMALDGWMPNRFALLSDRLVTQNGIIIMGLGSLILLWVSRGKVEFLLVLYSINVFVTFSLSQLGMVKHWWEVRGQDPRWRSHMFINSVGLLLTTTILVATVFLKFHEGGWLTLVITGALVAVAFMIKHHYTHTRKLLSRLDELLSDSVKSLPAKAAVKVANSESALPAGLSASSSEKTAMILVNGFSGLGLHTVFNSLRLFRGHFKNYVFIEVGLVDAGQFKGVEEIENLKKKIAGDLEKYKDLMNSHGFHAEGFYSLGTDVVEEVAKLVQQVAEHYPSNVVFAGQLVFPQETILTRALHNYTSFAIQRRLYRQGQPVLILPIRV